MAEPYLKNVKGWPEYTLEPNAKSEVISRVESGGTPNTKNETYWDGDIPWITPKELSNSGSLFYQHTERNITSSGLSNSSAKLIPPYSVLLTKRAPVGLVGINTVDMTTNQGFLNFICGTKLLPTYLAIWLKINTPYLHAVANGSTYDELYKSDLFEFYIAVPPIEYQEKIISLISSVDLLLKLKSPIESIMKKSNSLEWIANQNKRMEHIRDDLAYMLMSGKLDINDII